MNKVRLILFHEIRKHLQKKGFLFITLLLPLLLIGVALGVMIGDTVYQSVAGSPTDTDMPETPPIPTPESTPTAPIFSFLEPNKEPPVFGYVDQAGVLVVPTDEITITRFLAFPDEQAALEALRDETIEAYYVIPPDYRETGEISRYSPKLPFDTSDTEVFAILLRASLLHDHDMRLARRVQFPLSLETVRLDEHGQPLAGRQASDDIDSDPDLIVVPYLFTILLYMTIFASSGLLMNSVVEEKENRVIEILLTSLRPWQLLSGKILGLGLLGLLQVGLWVGLAALMIHMAVPGSSETLTSFNLPPYVWVLSLVYYLLAYLFYGSIMAGIGAVVTSTREASLFTMILILPVMTPMLFFVVIVEHPNGLVATILSLLPFSASIAMMMRLSLTDVVWWQIVLSLLLTVGGVVGSIWISARLFRTSSLLAGTRYSVRQIVNALRQSAS